MAEIRKRLKRTAATLEIPKNADPLSRARQKLDELEVDQGAITERTLHQFRIAGKRARYIAELAGKDAEATRLIGQLNHMQDVIGDWHDWSSWQTKQKNSSAASRIQHWCPHYATSPGQSSARR